MATSPSERSKSIARRMMVLQAQGRFNGEYPNVLAFLGTETDEALAPVRECLADMATRPIDDLDDFCWCYTDTGERSMSMVIAGQHLPKCERVRAVYESLKVTE